MGIFWLFGYDIETLKQFDQIHLERIKPQHVVKKLVYIVAPSSMTDDFTQIPRTPSHSSPWVFHIVCYILMCPPPDTLWGNLRILPLLYPITLLVVDDAPSHAVHLKHQRHHTVTYYLKNPLLFPFCSLHGFAHHFSQAMQILASPKKHHKINISFSRYSNNVEYICTQIDVLLFERGPTNVVDVKGGLVKLIFDRFEDNISFVRYHQIILQHGRFISEENQLKNRILFVIQCRVVIECFFTPCQIVRPIQTTKHLAQSLPTCYMWGCNIYLGMQKGLYASINNITVFSSHVIPHHYLGRVEAITFCVKQ